MLNIGSKIINLRKQLNISQTELAKRVGISRTIVGNYERDTNMPSIDILVKIAKVFDVSIGFLVGEGAMASYDKDLIKRIDYIENLNNTDKTHLFIMIDAFLRDAKARDTYK